MPRVVRKQTERGYFLIELAASIGLLTVIAFVAMQIMLSSTYAIWSSGAITAQRIWMDNYEEAIRSATINQTGAEPGALQLPPAANQISFADAPGSLTFTNVLVPIPGVSQPVQLTVTTNWVRGTGSARQTRTTYVLTSTVTFQPTPGSGSNTVNSTVSRTVRRAF